MVAAFLEGFSNVVLSNGGLPTGPIPKDFTEALTEFYKTLPVVVFGAVTLVVNRIR